MSEAKTMEDVKTMVGDRIGELESEIRQLRKERNELQDALQEIAMRIEFEKNLDKLVTHI